MTPPAVSHEYDQHQSNHKIHFRLLFSFNERRGSGVRRRTLD